MSAEAEGVVHDGVDLHLASLVRDVVEIAFRVLIFQVDCRGTMSCWMALTQKTSSVAPAAPSNVAGRALGGTDGKLLCVVAKDGLDGLRLGDVALRRAGAVALM